jgi:hypothetical protein
MVTTDSDTGAAGQPDHHVFAGHRCDRALGLFQLVPEPALSVRSGDFVTIEALTRHAYDDYERMIEGDPGAQSVFHWTKDAKNIDRRGAGPMDAPIHGRGAGEGFGVHICTGLVFIRDAQDDPGPQARRARGRSGEVK